MSLSEFGEVKYDSHDALLCDLTPPVQAGTLMSFELIDGPMVIAAGSRRQWRWSVTGGPSEVTETRSNAHPYRFVVPNVGSITVTGEMLLNGRPIISIPKTVSITSNAEILTAWASGSNADKALAEITTDLSAYITAAANATGANGISPRFLASVLMIEISNRPKADRFDELDEVREDLEELANERHGTGLFRSWNLNLHVHRSIGVGQTKMSTLAMALGMMPLIEHERVSGSSSAEDEIEEEFMKLRTSQMFYLWRKLAWSKSAVASVAKVLAHLKNRSNRYPGLSRTAFGANRRAMEIVASEYNLGATNSPEIAAGPTWYGQAVYGICTGSGSSGYRSLARSFTQFAHP